MRVSRVGIALIGATMIFGGANALQTSAPAEAPPAWAFPVPDHTKMPKIAPDTIERVAGSKVAYKAGLFSDDYFAPVWFPNEHPPMPKIVGQGEKPRVNPCAECHEETGKGGPESAALAGLPARYIVEQVQEFRAGRRLAAQPKMEAPHGMEHEAKGVTDAELNAAADYFSKLPFTSRTRVVESDTAPKTYVAYGLVYAKVPGGGTEPLGERIVEVPDDLDDWELANPHGINTAYVPRGSIARGKALVESGDGAAPCSSCHGADLNGTSIAPPLAGRSPSYLARQLFDIQYGTRKGPAVALMLPEVAHMTAQDRIAIVAYLASLK
jgi:cytochrome c553